METQTCFDLNNAIESWRAELAAQSDLTTDMRRELETHLRDAIVDLQKRGLSGEEAFLVARQRVGSPKQLGQECMKADPAAVWSERVFWMTLAVLLVWLWSSSSAYISVVISRATTNLLIHEMPRWQMSTHPLVDFAIETLRVVIRVLPIFWLAFYVAKGRLNANSRLVIFFRSRSRLAAFGLTWSLINSAVVFVAGGYAPIQIQRVAAGPPFTVSYPALINLVYSMSFPIAFVILLVLLMPAQFQAKPKAA